MHPAYANPRPDVAALVPRSATTVLDIGCSTGALGAALTARGHQVWGIEGDPALADEAEGRLVSVRRADVEVLAAEPADLGRRFDCVVMADVLEHLRDPWSVVRWAADHLIAGGSVVISVPNVRHLSLVTSVLVHRRWRYDELGIWDRTHLRWFAYRNLPDLLAGTDLRIVTLTRNRMLRIEPEHRLNRIAPYLGDLGTLQFIFRAESPPAG